MYKTVNPRGEFYLKVDGGKNIVNIESDISALKIMIYKKFIKQIDYLSVETVCAYNLWSSDKIFNIDLSGRLFLVENGFDEEKLVELSIPEIPFHQKDKVIITVGRLGTKSKNTEMFLQAIENIVDIKDWKFYFVGPIEMKECDFQKKIDGFFRRNPNLEKRVLFTGAIYDKKKLWEYYNKAKIFVFTSRYESYGIVLNEAYRFSNYIISTDVGGAKEIIDKGENLGILIEQENYIQLKNILENIINDDSYFYDYQSRGNSDNSWRCCLAPLVESIKNKSSGI